MDMGLERVLARVCRRIRRRLGFEHVEQVDAKEGRAGREGDAVSSSDIGQLGIVEGMDATTYHAVDACSASRLKAMRRSPAHCKWEMENPKESEAMEFGAALHCFVLETGKFPGRYHIVPSELRRGTKVWREAEELRPGKTLLKAGDFNAITTMTEAIARCPAAYALLNCNGRNEVSGFWEDDATGIACKMRADRLAELPAYGTLCVDVKTTEDASPEAFSASINRYGYALQGAFYLHGLAKLGVPCDGFVIVAVEKSPPFGVGVYLLDDESMDHGRAEFVRLMERYAECVKTGEWPCYSPDIQQIGLPGWALKRRDNEQR
jgi:exodeoxyribonuclease VIII